MYLFELVVEGTCLGIHVDLIHTRMCYVHLYCLPTCSTTGVPVPRIPPRPVLYCRTTCSIVQNYPPYSNVGVTRHFVTLHLWYMYPLQSSYAPLRGRSRLESVCLQLWQHQRLSVLVANNLFRWERNHDSNILCCQTYVVPQRNFDVPTLENVVV